MTNPSACKILIVTVIYNQRIADTNVYKTLLTEKEDVYIYDNSPAAQPTDHIPSNWIYISDPSNPGLSYAYNKAARYAAANRYDWLLISDQDTIYPQRAVEQYRSYIGNHLSSKMFIPKVKISDGCYLSPVRNRKYIARISHRLPPSGEINLNRFAVINSGILVTTDSFLSCGGYSDKVFLDFSDFQFIERFGNRYNTVYVTDIICQQDFSDVNDDAKKKLHRFELFCLSLKEYECLKKKNRIFIHLAVIKRAFALSAKLKSIIPIKLFFSRYL